MSTDILNSPLFSIKRYTDCNFLAIMVNRNRVSYCITLIHDLWKEIIYHCWTIIYRTFDL